MRTAFQIIVGFILALFTVVAIGTTTVWWSVGTPAHAASTVGSVLSSPDGAKGVADMFVGMALDGASEQDRADMEQQRDAMVAAAATGISAAAPQVQAIVETALGAITTGTQASIDPTPLLNSVMGAMHAVDPNVPAQMDGGVDPITIDGTSPDLAPVRTAFSGAGLWWLGWVLVLLVLVLDALIGKRGGMRRWLIPSIFLAVPGLIWLILSFLAPGQVAGYADNDYQAMLIGAGVSSVASKLLIVSLIVSIVGVLLFIASLVVRGSRSTSGAPAAAPPAPAPGPATGA